MLPSYLTLRREYRNSDVWFSPLPFILQFLMLYMTRLFILYPSTMFFILFFKLTSYRFGTFLHAYTLNRRPHPHPTPTPMLSFSPQSWFSIDLTRITTIPFSVDYEIDRLLVTAFLTLALLHISDVWRMSVCSRYYCCTEGLVWSQDLSSALYVYCRSVSHYNEWIPPNNPRITCLPQVGLPLTGLYIFLFFSF